MDKRLILKEIQKAYNFSKDGDFAQFLGIKQSTLSSWYSRGTIDYERIIAKCDKIDANWLLTGKGNILKEKKSVVYKNDDVNNMIEEPVEIVIPVSATGNDKIIKLLEAQISLLEENKAMQQDKIDTQAKEIAHLKQEITRLKNNSQSIKEIPSVPDDPMPPLPAGTSSKSRSHLRK